MSFPTEPEAITAAWLTAALGEAIGGATVCQVSFEPIGDGLAARSYRLALNWDGCARAAPSSLVAKVATSNSRRLATARATGTYNREVRFYREHASNSGVRCPRCYLAEVNPDTGHFILLLEDLADARPGDQLEGCSVEEARLAITEAAKLHASRWDDPALEELRYLIRHRPGGWVATRLEESWGPFLERFGDRMPPGSAELGERIRAAGEEWLEAHGTPLCLVHNDYRLDNMLFGTRPAAPPIAVLDWQTLGHAAGAWDVAYFLGSSFPNGRAEHELRLLAHYHAALVEAGVEGYSFERCQDDYRRYSLGAVLLTIVGTAFVPATDERGREMFGVIAERQFTQALELGASEFLKGA